MKFMMIHGISLKLAHFWCFGDKKHISAPGGRKHQYSLSNINDSGSDFSRQNTNFIRIPSFSWKFMNFHENSVISWNSMISCTFCDLAWKVPPEPLVILIEYWCFRGCMNSIGFHEKAWFYTKSWKPCKSETFCKNIIHLHESFTETVAIRQIARNSTNNKLIFGVWKRGDIGFSLNHWILVNYHKFC